MSNNDASLPIAITLGDPAGIGPEIIAKAFRDAATDLRGCFVAGDVATVRRAAQAIAATGGPALPVALLETPGEVRDVPAGCIPVLQVVAPTGAPIVHGQVSAEAGRIAGDCVVWAARAALRAEIAAIVTAPLHKEALAAAGFPYPGHTELLQAEAAAHLGRPLSEVPVRMMLANDELRTVLVSIHMSLRQAIEAVTVDGVLQTLRIAHRALGAVLGRTPKIGVAGLNPHAGEGGLFGSEERDIIAPAIAAARAEGIDADGPHAPDTVFMRARAKVDGPGEFDVVIAMYHDQGLIPVKYLGVEKGVNVTLGLPLVRTSPDHGTAFDIAGTGRADASSLIEAVRMARSLVEGVNA
ncbi:4-hydroxythreonine-4-phosphate dehydrogenase PdxA [Variovorax sp. J31P179]|uniref:4-hydroxythreonine-4-phosphate dehydrogenase PdxA n=1 Tax=Variovorax sp. J31P179 TaxID=3053508 RepID=UPI002575DAFC|nr:4-hydroxythreonine-4-phosphate dehydrogenase PdxA [Variovorax sp. J31P179]MDM0083773.1 4-hydroxythreonine-4-phosphate dehydrogenase PdxA [Variovorax sp. J31P179]